MKLRWLPSPMHTPRKMQSWSITRTMLRQYGLRARAPPSEAPSEGKSQDALRLRLARRRHVGCDLAPSRGPSSRRRGRPAPRRVQSLDRS